MDSYLKENVTIYDVARKSKVSTATVSRVINKPFEVSEDTKIRVYEAIKELKYVPNINGKKLRKTSNKSIAIIMPNISNPFYSDIVRAIDDTARKNQYETTICLTDLNADFELKYLDSITSGQYGGAILIGCELRDPRVVERLKKCKVVQCCEYNEDADAPHISINNFQASYQAVKYLIDLGHKRIGFIGSTNKCISSIERYQGYMQCLNDSGCMASERYVSFADAQYSYNSAFYVAKRMLLDKDRPTAIFTISDTMAVAVLNAARVLNISVPQELSVFGCDNVDISKIVYPDISTIDQPRYMIGERSMKLLIDQLEENYIPEKNIYVDHKILVRTSTSTCKDTA